MSQLEEYDALQPAGAAEKLNAPQELRAGSAADTDPTNISRKPEVKGVETRKVPSWSRKCEDGEEEDQLEGREQPALAAKSPAEHTAAARSTSTQPLAELVP